MKYLVPVVRWFKGFSRPIPSRDWHVTLIVVVLVGVGMIGIALYFYIGIQSGAIIVPQAPPHKSPPSVSRDKLTEVLQVYEQRMLKYKAGL